MDDVSRETKAQAALSSVPGLSEYVDLLAGPGVERGLIGPREVPRLWTRHIANCAVVVQRPGSAEVPLGASVIDVGSGAGLPGVVWALVRPDLRVRLLEPLLRRSTFLSEVVAALRLGARVEVIRSRAEQYPGPCAQVVTARAVANLRTLATWTLPLACPGGWVLAMKGSGAQEEVAEASRVIARLGGTDVRVGEYGSQWLDQPATVVHIRKRAQVRGAPTGRRGTA